MLSKNLISINFLFFWMKVEFQMMLLKIFNAFKLQNYGGTAKDQFPDFEISSYSNTGW